MKKKYYKIGDYVKTTGVNMPSTWHTMFGIIIDINEYIVVKWDNTGVEDDKLPEEIRLVPRRNLIDEWEREIKYGRLLILQREFNLSMEEAEIIYNMNPACFPHHMKEKFYFFDRL